VGIDGFAGRLLGESPAQEDARAGAALTG
jgi:hypothetical protein